MGKIFYTMDSVANEAIDFQNDDTAAELTKLYQKVLDTIEDDEGIKKATLDQIGLNKNIDKFIFSRFGIKINTYFNTNTWACMPLYLNKSHIFIDSHWHGNFSFKDQDRFSRDNVGKKGTVDLKNAKLGGIYSEYKHVLLMDVKSAYLLKIDAKELAAITLHEIGHLFTMLEMGNRLQITNQVMQSITEGLKKGDDIKKYEHKLVEIADNFNLSKADIQDIVNSHNNYVIGAKLYRKLVGACSTQMKSDTYYFTASEQVADQFCNRFGLGAEILTALHKLHVAFGVPEASKATREALMISDIMFIVGSIGGIVAGLIAGAILMPLIMAGFFYMCLWSSGDSLDRDEHGKVVDRFKRVRNDLVRQIAVTSNLDKELAKDIIKNIGIMDNIIKSNVDYRGLLSKISNVLFSANRKVIEDREIQLLMETLANNNLFVKHAELKLQTEE